MDFNSAFDFVLGREGGYVNDPHDPGGETNFGITKRDYPDLDIKNLSIKKAREIYKRDYWDKVKSEKLPLPLRLSVFDAAVNQGPGTAIKLLQRSLKVKADGKFGPITMNAIRSTKTSNLKANFLAERALRYVETRNFDRYGRGWFRRLFHVSTH